MNTRRAKPSITAPVDAETAEAALLDVETRLQNARDAIAVLMTMENARTANLHEDDDYLRRMIRSVREKRRKMAPGGRPSSERKAVEPALLDKP